MWCKYSHQTPNVSNIWCHQPNNTRLFIKPIISVDYVWISHRDIILWKYIYKKKGLRCNVLEYFNIWTQIRVKPLGTNQSSLPNGMKMNAWWFTPIKKIPKLREKKTLKIIALYAFPKWWVAIHLLFLFSCKK